MIRAYKLFKVRKNGTLGSLFINRKAILPIGIWLEAGSFPTKGYKYRPGWHATAKAIAPHLSTKGRVWRMVEIKKAKSIKRPAQQGSQWWLSAWLRIIPTVEERNNNDSTTQTGNTKMYETIWQAPLTGYTRTRRPTHDT